MEKEQYVPPLITNDAIAFGILMGILALVFYTASQKEGFFKRFYTFIPPILLCYFIPALLNTFGIMGGTDENGNDISELYFMASRYLLPASLVLLCLSIDLKGIINLGPKAIIMFLTATAGIIIGGPIALFIVVSLFPEIVSDPSTVWQGLSTVAGSWIGGGANQTAMKEISDVSEKVFSSMIVVDVAVSNIWMGFLLFGATRKERIDRWLKADSSSITELEIKLKDYQAKIERTPTTLDLFILMGIAFSVVGFSHLMSDIISPWMETFRPTLERLKLTSLTSSFFWLVVVSTTVGVLLSFTRARKLEGIGASKWGSVFIYVLVATIGMKMDIKEILKEPGLFVIGLVWMSIHVALLISVAKIIRSPFFFVAVGSQSNVGGAASAPVVASAFSPVLAPVGVLLAVLGYALGTYGAILCMILMRIVSG